MKIVLTQEHIRESLDILEPDAPQEAKDSLAKHLSTVENPNYWDIWYLGRIRAIVETRVDKELKNGTTPS